MSCAALLIMNKQTIRTKDKHATADLYTRQSHRQNIQRGLKHSRKNILNVILA